MTTAIEALARTAQLIRMDLFGGEADDEAIVAGLQRTGIAIVADQANLASPAAQTLVTTLAGLTAMLGIWVELDFPDVPLIARQPPLRGSGLRTAITEWIDELIPRSALRLDAPTLTFVVGSTRWLGGPAFRLVGGAWSGEVAPVTVQGTPWLCEWPIGALAVAGAAAAEAFRAAIPQIVEATGLAVDDRPDWRLDINRSVSLDLRLDDREVVPADVGEVDFISGGAITTNALYALLRVPGLTGRGRIFEPDILGPTNLNRYPLMWRSSCGAPKAQLLAHHQTSGFQIEAVQQRYEVDSGALAAQVLVGVDHIPSRWVVQRNAPGWVCVGATSHDFVIVSTHEQGAPCAGCVHPRDDETAGDIPTISFVSFWAGLLQARALLARAADVQDPRPIVNAWPLGLFGVHGVHRSGASSRADCPVACAASR